LGKLTDDEEKGLVESIANILNASGIRSFFRSDLGSNSKKIGLIVRQVLDD